MRILKAHVRRDLELGRAPLQGIPEAPEEYHDLWDTAHEQEQLVPVTDAEPGMPQAYVIHALTVEAGSLGMDR